MNTDIYERLLDLLTSAGAGIMEVMLTQVALDVKVKVVFSVLGFICFLIIMVWIISCCKNEESDLYGEDMITFLMCFVIALLMLVCVVEMFTAYKMTVNPGYYAIKMFADLAIP